MTGTGVDLRISHLFIAKGKIILKLKTLNSAHYTPEVVLSALHMLTNLINPDHGC